MAEAARVLRFRPSTSETPLPYSPVGSDGDDTTGVSLPGKVESASMPAVFSQPSRIIPLMNLDSADLELRRPLYVVLEESDGFVVAMSYDLEIAEQGATEFEALSALREAIVEFYQELTELSWDAPPLVRRRLDFLVSLTH